MPRLGRRALAAKLGSKPNEDLSSQSEGGKGMVERWHTDYPGTSEYSSFASLGGGKRKECDKGQGGERPRDCTHQANSTPGRFTTGAREEGCPVGSHHPLASRGGVGEL